MPSVKLSISPISQSRCQYFFILGFHDCVELFLGLAADTLNVGKPKMDFMELSGTVSAKLSPDQLQQRDAMKGLMILVSHSNTMAISFPSFKLTITEPLQPASSHRTLRRFFGVKFENITIIYLVQHEEVLESLAIAQKALDQGDTEISVINSARAFHQLLHFPQRWISGSLPPIPLLFWGRL